MPKTGFSEIQSAREAIAATASDTTDEAKPARAIYVGSAGRADLKLAGMASVEPFAQAIIDGRPWADPADLSQIPGISDAMVADWLADPGLIV